MGVYDQVLNRVRSGAMGVYDQVLNSDSNL